jgi:hypothetical protein
VKVKWNSNMPDTTLLASGQPSTSASALVVPAAVHSSQKMRPALPPRTCSQLSESRRR